MKNLSGILSEVPENKSESLHGTTHKFKRGEVISVKPEQFWWVCEGVVLLNSINTEGENVVIGIATTGTVFCLPLTHSHLSIYQGITLSKGKLMVFTPKEVESSPNLNQSIMRGLMRRLSQTERLLEIKNYHGVRKRLFYLLSLLKEEIGESHPLGIRYSVRLSQEQLAKMIGTTRITITNLLGKMKQEKLITYDRCRHIILTQLFENKLRNSQLPANVIKKRTKFV